MPRYWPHDEIPDSNVWPTGLIQFEVEDLEEVQSKTNKLMITATLRGILPPDVENIPHYEYFVIGSDDDPQAQDVKTWKKSMGAQSLKKLLKATQTPLTDDLHVAMEQAKKRQGIVTTTQTIETEGEYAGRPRCNLGRFFALGERQPMIAAETPGARGVAASPATAAPSTASPIPTGAPTRASAPAPVPVPVAPAPVVAPPAAAPPTPSVAPAPVAAAPAAAPAVPAGTPAAAGVPTTNAEELLACSLCPVGSPAIPRSQFTAHVQMHETGQIPTVG